ncbi:MAG: hypothetical protein ACLFR6_00205 [Salinarchaeum sp.]
MKHVEDPVALMAAGTAVGYGLMLAVLALLVFLLPYLLVSA